VNRGILTQVQGSPAMPYGLLGRPTPVALPAVDYALDVDAADYIKRVEAADGQALELPIRLAIDAFVRGCKDDGIWPAIKASCILAGARTLSGALVPLVGTAPTNNNFVSGDYDRKMGLIGNGSTKYINSNFQFESLAKNCINNHLSYWRTLNDSKTFAAGANFSANPNFFITNSAARNFHVNTQSLNLSASDSSITGFRGMTRNENAIYYYRVGGAMQSFVWPATSTGTNYPLYILARNNTGSADLYATGKVSFYSIGEALDLALLDGRVTTLINAIGAALS
jgi:hypothetical protein